MTGAGRWRLAAALAVVVVVEENHAFEQVIGSLAAPFLNHLAARGTMTGPTLVDQLEAHHIPWAAYFRGLPRPCSPAAQAGHYSEAVDPFMHAALAHPTQAAA